MTVIPSFLITGILATIIGLITMIWAAARIHKRNGGLVLILLSIALLLFGGGLVPPVIGIVAGIVAFKINKPLTQQPGSILRFLAKLWPWPLVVFFAWMLGQFAVGHFFNDFLLNSGFPIPILVVGLFALSILSAYARDLRDRDLAVA